MKIKDVLKVTATLIVVLFLNSKAVLGQTPDSISEMAKEYMYPFAFNDSFRGEGWDKIRTLLEEHKYFIIGEDHGLAEVPLFTKALVRDASFDLFVTEIDSVTAAISKEVALRSEAEIDAFHKQNPSALSFYSAREEFELLQELSKSNIDVWGLDQVSLLSTGIVLRRLHEICKSAEAKTLALQLAGLSDKLFNEATNTGDYDKLLIYSSKKEVFERLNEALQNESVEAQSILKDIEASWKIYNGIDNANYNTRIRDMKSKLLNYYVNSVVSGKQHEKVLYKFGAHHVGRAQSVFGIYDVGNFVSNIAEAEGASSYHLMIVGKKGFMNSFLLAKDMQSAPFDITTKDSSLNGLLPLANLVEDDEWAFFDLKPIRQQVKTGKIEIENALLTTLLRGYDGLVIIPETSASTHY